MAKRQLNRRQRWRIEKIQEERNSRANQRESKLQEELAGGDFGEEQLGLVTAHFGIQAEVESKQGERYRCYLRANLPPLVTGDKVVWRTGNQQNGIITAIQPRASELSRTDSSGRLKIIAANVDLLVIVFAPLPTPYANLLDRYLIAAKHAGIRPLLLFNKLDLVNEQNSSELEDLLNIYRNLNYQILEVSKCLPETIHQLQTALNNHMSVFVGQSGVGKSSLINTLLPEAELRVGALSELTNKGAHTTTTAKLFHLPMGGNLIDSPGIRDFALTHINKEIVEQGFIEFKPYLGHCKFRNCKHQQEPGCALLKAIDEGKIHPKRMSSYRHIITSLELDD
ncbi:small ribosomal subunit biogenesis GTPase RsgA [Entomomonas asaccharolytica]|uniref:Small ribosomal subunit biogenesis GTPase RsgA n=1 Tax=Entomomonas asaccharolytica TaxID=2785331 RepID=A0A974RXZ9_9GAMM|nr:small ribosomal subunit biogenesis GTPase RsgA [Entomomonas asaccharolytica]QQP85414.1 small ribosomal subunit biogenesis GTPase RsgA [Entomomonas asaccharolytica]